MKKNIINPSKKKGNGIVPAKEFPKVHRMLRDAAHEAVNPYFQYPEAEAEAYWAFMECCRTYKPEFGTKFSTYVYSRVRFHLKTHIMNRIKAGKKLVYMEINDDLLREEGRVKKSLTQALEERDDLSPQERELLQTLLNPPKHIPTLKFGWNDMKEIEPEELLEAIKDHLGFEWGVDNTYIDIMLFELKMKLEANKFSMSCH